MKFVTVNVCLVKFFFPKFPEFLLSRLLQLTFSVSAKEKAEGDLLHTP